MLDCFFALQPSLGEKDPGSIDAEAEAARKASQGQMQRLYEDSLVLQHSELALVEGMAIREALQEKVCTSPHTTETTSKPPERSQGSQENVYTESIPDDWAEPIGLLSIHVARKVEPTSRLDSARMTTSKQTKRPF